MIHNPRSRRSFLASGLVGTLGLALSPSWQRLLAGPANSRKAEACILVWLNGGPSHLDTFDPKPGAPTGGPFKAIDTSVPGVRLSEHLPNLAAQAHRFALLRSLTSREADHDRAYHFIHTGNAREETVAHPTLGAVAAREWADEAAELPAFVGLNGASPSPGFLGVDFAPYVVGNLDAPLENVDLPEGVDEARLGRRLKATAALNAAFAARADAGQVAEYDRLTARALRFRGGKARKAFDLSAEDPKALGAYGVPASKADGPPPEGVAPDGQEGVAFARSCLLARRLIEHGVRFVELTLDGWDTHSDNFNTVKKLSGQLDTPLAALLADLADRHLLEKTLVVVMGEFGRTPEINKDNGRDHYSEAFSGLLAGGGVKGGRVIGATDDKGVAVKDRPVTVPDLYATLLTAFGFNPARVYHTPEGRPIKLADKGRVVSELFA